MTDEAGLTLGMRWTPLDAVGLYVPGGKAAYPSSVLMNALPARVAGVAGSPCACPRRTACSTRWCWPPRAAPGVTEIYRVGGAQAVAALAYGTATIAPVDRIVGPGNAYVAEAKRQVFGRVGIDSIAGPSEVVILADAAQDPRRRRHGPAGAGRARRERAEPSSSPPTRPSPTPSPPPWSARCPPCPAPPSPAPAGATTAPSSSCATGTRPPT